MRFKRSRVRQIRKNTSVKKSSKVSEIPAQSKLSMNRKNPSVRKYAVSQKCEMSTQEKQASYPESNVVKHAVTTKGPRGLRNLENCYMHVIFQYLAEGTSSLRSSPKQLVRKEGRNLKEQVLALLKLVHNTEGKVIHPVQARHVVKVELPQFADNTQQDAHEFLIAILPVQQLPRHQGTA